MAKGIELKKLMQIISEVEKVDGRAKDYTLDEGREKPLIPLPLRLQENPIEGQRKVIKTSRYLDVIFTLSNGVAQDIAVVGRYNVFSNREPIAKRVALEHNVEYDNGKLYMYYSNSLTEIKNNLRKIMYAEKVFDDEVSQAMEWDSTRSR